MKKKHDNKVFNTKMHIHTVKKFPKNIRSHKNQEGHKVVFKGSELLLILNLIFIYSLFQKIVQECLRQYFQHDIIYNFAEDTFELS